MTYKVKWVHEGNASEVHEAEFADDMKDEEKKWYTVNINIMFGVMPI